MRTVPLERRVRRGCREDLRRLPALDAPGALHKPGKRREHGDRETEADVCRRAAKRRHFGDFYRHGEMRAGSQALCVEVADKATMVEIIGRYQADAF